MKLLIAATLLASLPPQSQARQKVSPGAATVRRMCSGCHSLETAISANHTPVEWRSIVQDMVARGAQGNRADVETAVAYLSREHGLPNKPPALQQSGPIPGPAAVRTFDARRNIPREQQWPAYGHDPGAQRFSPLRQITAANVARLQRAWTFHLGAGGSEATPLVIHNKLYVTSPNAIFALEPETGKLLWKYASHGVARRGLAFWQGDGGARIFCGVESGKLIALDAKTGKPALSFGDNGLVDLRAGVTGDIPDARFFLQSPPSVFKNVIITGGNNGELSPSQGAYGDVRGWDARTGTLLWTFHTVPRPGEPGNETWAPDSWKQRSGTNVWGLMTVDEAHGIVYLPLGCPTSDMYGADRHGDGLYGNSLVALDALTGKIKWFHQLVHHDLWDYDLAAPPALVDIQQNGRTIPAVVQITKMGLLFVFDRFTGEPVFGMEALSVPQSKVPGEQSSPAQPFPIKPAPLAKINFEESDIYDASPEHAQFCRDLFQQNHMVTQGPYTPMPVEGNGLTFPSTLGGGNWGGVSYDPMLGFVFTNIMNMGQWGHMEPRTDPKTGETTYTRMAGNSGAYGRFWNPQTHIPCTKPPFGELVAVNLSTGEIAWRTPLGRIPALEALGVRNTGTLNLGGSIATAAGLLFIAATNDSTIRAFESRTGRELWSAPLDTSAYTVPVTYMGRDGRQYLTVVAGGTGYFGSPAGDSVTTFALPR